MAACIFDRLCSLDTSTSATKESSRLIYVEAEAKIFVAWKESGGNPATSATVHFGKYDPVTKTTSGEVEVYDFFTAFNPTAIDSIDMIRMASGRLVIVVYSQAAGGSFSAKTVAFDSVDNGATWGSPVAITSTVNSSVQGFADNGTNLVLISHGTASGDLTAWTRTGAVDLTPGTGAWGAGTVVYNDNGTTLRTWDITVTQQVRLGCYMSSATVGFVAGWKGKNDPAGSNDLNQFSVLYTANGWATATEVLVKAFTLTGGNTVIHHVVTSSGRVYLMCVDMDNASKPYLSYSDNAGLTWTNIGTPSIVTTTMATIGLSTLDGSFDLALALDDRENLLLCHSSGNAISPNGHHIVYRSVDPTSTSDWAVAGDCTYDSSANTFSAACAGHAVAVGSDVWRLVTMVRWAGYSTLEFFFIAGAAIPDEPAEPASPPEAIESGADDNNMLLRLPVEDGQGWSVHTHAVACFLPWDEGDAETGREVPILLTGSPSIDPAIADPDLIPAFWRIETGLDDGFGKRFYVDASSDQQEVRYDPFRTIVRSKAYTITGDFDMNVVRAIMVTYSRHGNNPLPMQVWVDGSLCSVVQMPATAGLEVTSFFAMPTTANVGNQMQFVMDVTDLDPWSIEAWGVKYMRKKVRGGSDA